MILSNLGCEYMKASEEGASRYLEEAMINELIEKHLAQGYSVLNSSSLLNDVQPDLALEKDGKKLLIEVVVRGTREREQADKILQIHKALQTIKNAEFKTVFVNIPKRVEVTIEGIEGVLEREMTNEGYLIDIGNGFRIDEVSDVQIDDVTISSNSIHVRGSFVVSGELQFGPSRDGMEIEESFPGTFQATLDGDLEPLDVDIQVDTSSWGENRYEE